MPQRTKVLPCKNKMKKKLVRKHTVDEKGGLVLPRGDSTTALLSRQCFLELLEVTRRELSPCHKLTHFHVEVCTLH